MIEFGEDAAQVQSRILVPAVETAIWNELYPKLKALGWTYALGNELENYWYFRPKARQIRKSAREHNVHYFKNPKEAIL